MNRNAPFSPLAWIGENLVRVLGELRLLAGWSTSVDHLLMPLAALFFGRFHRSMEQLNLLLEQFRQGTLPLPQAAPAARPSHAPAAAEIAPTPVSAARPPRQAQTVRPRSCGALGPAARAAPPIYSRRNRVAAICTARTRGLPASTPHQPAREKISHDTVAHEKPSSSVSGKRAPFLLLYRNY